MLLVKDKEYVRSSEIARLAGVSTDTLRYYERLGIFDAPRRSSNGYREYSASILERVRLVRSALGVGFRLDELARILKIRDAGGAPCREVRSLAHSRLEEIDAQIKQLVNLRDALEELLREWDSILATTPSNGRAELLGRLANRSAGARHASGLSTAKGRSRRKGRTL
jgi:DNA-binding transcriptional MerR regulator